MRTIKFKKYITSFYNQSYYYTKLKNGLTVFLVDIENAKTTEVFMNVSFGGEDLLWENLVLPAGISHFLEHMVFTSQNNNYPMKFHKLNASVNAYTSANHTTFNFETPTFTLRNPNKSGYTFTGWTGSNGSTPQTTVTITQGSTGNKNYTANWLPTYPINFSVINGNGTLSATVDGTTITNGSQVTQGKTVVFKANPAYNFKVKEWKLNGNLVNGTNSIYYLYNVTEENTVTVEFETIIGINNREFSRFTVYPNPTTDVVYIKTETDLIPNVKVFSADGRLLYNGQCSVIDVSEYASGIYYMQIEREVVKIVKN